MHGPGDIVSDHRRHGDERACGQEAGFDGRAERLVGDAIRCWLEGYETGNINSWEKGWRLFSLDLGSERARSVVTELACWVRAVTSIAARRVEYRSSRDEARGFCADEMLAIRMIAAGQHNAIGTMRRCGRYLTGVTDTSSIEVATRRLAGALDAAGVHLRPEQIQCHVNCANAGMPQTAGSSSWRSR